MQILYATDGSGEASAAGQLLTNLKLKPSDSVTVLTVLPPGDADTGEGVVNPPYPEEAEEVLAAARALLAPAGAELGAQVRRGHEAAQIRQAAAELRADLVVLGASRHSRFPDFLLGSVTDRVVRHAPCPVLVGRPLSGPLRRVVVGVDDSARSKASAEWLRRLPLPSDCEIRLVTIVPLLDSWLRSHVRVAPPLVDELTTLAEHARESVQERLRSLAATLANGGKRAVTEIRSGDPALALLQVAEEEGADLVVVGSHGQTAAERFLLGSVSEKVLRHAPCSVLVVRSST